ncbi:hypothetical protein [Myxacorys almedinensis]|uniref:Uncharacterized protein n=1 Tax=Myxacorys almedinensis A TaxID=2690445 RepID=A0A8J7ZAU5_9CYAN|nr:hypothetical protein [Myxacorys almedinensis]NDJ19543.1 hypothetical protein [Myxacorys almedinensis A]
MIHHKGTSVFGLTLALYLGTVSSAQALPGQNVQTVMRWVQNHALLSPFERGIGELSGLPFYNSQAKVENGTVVFAMNPTDRTDKIVGEEIIAYQTQSNAGNTIFTRTNSEGLGIVQRIYDQSLTNDFQKSKYVARVEFNYVDLRFFQGKRFGYSTVSFKQPTDGQWFYHFRVISLENLNGLILGEQQCRRQSADGCE